MKHIHVLFAVVFSLLLSSIAICQVSSQNSIKGRLVDSNTGLPLDSCFVEVLNARDSSVITSVAANKNGEFTVVNLSIGNYLIKASHAGYISKSSAFNKKEGSTFDIGVISLSKSILLKEVMIVGEADAVKIKKDTIEYNAGSFKTTPDADVEQLVKKLPGVEVDQAGNIKAQGEEVNKLTVNGRDFFGNDPKMATKNLPADAVSKVQIIDSQTPQAKNTGIDDGKRQKVINLVLKEDKKGGWFGNVSVAGGTGKHYSASTSANYFTDKRQVNLILLSNNINQGYAGEDVGNLTGSSTGGGSGEVNGISYGRTSPGNTRINSGAFNFSDRWGKKQNIEFRATYNGNLKVSDVITRSAVQNFQSNGTFYNTSESHTNSREQRHDLDMAINYQDSLLSVYFSPTVTLGITNSNSFNITSTADVNKKLINNGYQQINNNEQAASISGILSITRRFRQKKGAIALTVGGNNSSRSLDNNNQNTINYYNNGLPNGQDLVNQQQNLDAPGSSFNIQNDISRTISRDRKTSVVLSSSINMSNGNSDQRTYDYNPLTGLYDLSATALTSEYTNKQIKYASALGFNKTSTKLTLSAYANLQNIALKGTNIGDSHRNEINRNYLSFLPRASVSYKAGKNTTFSFSFSSSANAPSLQNLQPVQNNNNPLYIRTGNPDLKVANNYNFQLGFNTFDTKTNSSASYRLSYGLVFNAFGTASSFDSQTGITNVEPINVNGNNTISLSGNFGRPTGLNGLRVNYGFSASNRKSINFVNTMQNTTSDLTAGITVGLNYAYEESLNIAFNSRSSYTVNKNSIQAATNNSYFSFNNTVNISYGFIKKWRLNVDVGQQSFARQNAGLDNNVVIVNAGLQKYFLEKNQLNLQLKAFDLFNQNSGISRIIANNRIEDTQVNNIRRYFSLRLTYKINKIVKKAQ